MINLFRDKILIVIILLISSFSIFYRLNELMSFIGDQAWFYLSARDLILTGEIPLVGITASHTWLHQGPLWTYFLAVLLWIFKFNPIITSYITAFMGVITVYVLYKVCSLIFTKRIGLISAALYAASPLAVIYSRMSYHTVPIPFFTILYIYSLYKWIKGEANFFPISIFFIVVLYNFELAAAVLAFVLITLLAYGFWQRKKWAIQISNKKIVLLSVLAFLVPMLPILIYDATHGFLQTLKFAAWIVYRILSFLGLIGNQQASLFSFKEMIFFLSLNYKHLIFSPNSIIALLIFILSFSWFFKNLIKSFSLKKLHPSNLIIGLIFIIPFFGFLTNQTPSQAYLPLLFPSIIIITSLFFDRLMHLEFLLKPTVLIIILISFFNIFYLISNNYFVAKINGRITFAKRLEVAKEIVKKTQNNKYNIIGIGEGSEFESFTMNYEYLTWWLGKAPSKQKQKLQFIINEMPYKINLKVIDYESKN